MDYRHFLSPLLWLKTQIKLPEPRENTEFYIWKGSFPDFDWKSWISWIHDARFGLQEIVLFIIIIYISLVFYRKIRYPFWNNQPVLHTYDIFSRWIYNTPRIICKTPTKLKYYSRVSSTQTVETYSTDNMSREIAQEICQFLRENWIPSDRVLSTMIEKNLFSIFVGNEYKSFYTLITPKSVAAEPIKIEGVAISHPATLYYGLNGAAEKVPTYLIDYMATQRDDKSDTIYALFQTHEYCQRTREKNCHTTIFKKEITACDSLVPLLQYECSLYYVRLFMKLPPLPAHFQIVEITHNNNTDILHGLFERKHIVNTFKLCVLNSMPNLVALLKNRQIRIFCLRRHTEDIFAFYFFRDPYLFYEDLEGKQLDLVASFINTEDFDLAYHGFLHSLREILKKKSREELYNVLQIHGLAHNQILEEKWKKNHTCIMKTPVYYYVYNYIYTTVDKNDAFIL